MGKLITETPYSEVTATLEALDRLGLEREDLVTFRKASSYVQMEVVRLMKCGEKKPFVSNSDTPSIKVDYGMSFAEMIAAGRYDWTIGDITEERFPVKGIGKVEREVELIHFDYDIFSDNVVNELAKRGLRPATIEELLAFGAKYPELQLKFPIVALGSSARVDGDLEVSCLDGDVAERCLNIGWWGRDWPGRCRFLAIRNK